MAPGCVEFHSKVFPIAFVGQTPISCSQDLAIEYSRKRCFDVKSVLSGGPAAKSVHLIMGQRVAFRVNRVEANANAVVMNAAVPVAAVPVRDAVFNVNGELVPGRVHGRPCRGVEAFLDDVPSGRPLYK